MQVFIVCNNVYCSKNLQSVSFTQETPDCSDMHAAVLQSPQLVLTSSIGTSCISMDAIGAGHCMVILGMLICSTLPATAKGVAAEGGCHYSFMTKTVMCDVHTDYHNASCHKKTAGNDVSQQAEVTDHMSSLLSKVTRS